MKFLLLGADTEECRATAQLLTASGHSVTVLSEDPRQLSCYKELGAACAVGSPFSFSVLEELLANQDLAVFFGTKAPRALIPERKQLVAYDRFRREASRVLIEAALRSRLKLVIFISTAGIYGNQGDRVVTESLPPNPPSLLRSFVDMEEQAKEAGEFKGLKFAILRLGMVYSAHCWHTSEVFRLVSEGHTPPLGAEKGFVSPVHAEDVAQAVQLAALRCPPGKILNIADDNPVRFNDLLKEVALRLGSRPPGAMPSLLLRLSLGKDIYQLLKLSCRVDNSLAKKILLYKPKYPSILERLDKEIEIWRAHYLGKAQVKGKRQAQKTEARTTESDITGIAHKEGSS